MAAKQKSKAAAAKPAPMKSAAPKAATPNKVSLKQLAAVLAEEHQMTKKAGEAMLNDLVALITKHLKKGERIRIAGLGILRCASAPPAWAAILQPARRSRSRRARRSRSAPPRN